MINKELLIFIVLIFIAACNSEGVKIYKVDYKGNVPEGTFKAVIGNHTIFTNGPSILEVQTKRNPDFFCYSVNKQILCRFSIYVKLNDEASKKFAETTQSLIETESKSGKNRTILLQRINYYLNDKNLDGEDTITAREIKGQLTEVLAIPVLGNGATQEEAKNNALKKSKEIMNILIDKV